MVPKATAARWITAGWLTYNYVKEMEDNYQEGDWLEAAKDTAWYAVTAGPLMAPELVWGLAYPYVAGYALGVVVTATIAEATGIGEFEEVIELGANPPNPIEWAEVVGPAIQSEITEPVIEYITEELWQRQLVDPIGGWLSRRETDIREVWEITRPRAPSWL